MSLYGRTDSNANVTKAGRGIAATSQAKTTVFVDETEAALESNKERGLNAPGWWSYFTYTDADGKTRHKAEHLVTLANAEANADESQADDAIAADAAVTIAIGTQPANATVANGAQLQLSVVATATPPGDDSVLTFQWQKLSDGAWGNISGATAATFTVATAAVGDAGSYRVKLNSTNGAPEVISATAVVEIAL
tara:strand:+ start:2247 stop:2828 length:582 start_codon:yes stop_codon:yes gene_type:complete